MKVFIILLVIWMINSVDAISQCKLDVDSLFQSHFFSLDTTVQCNTPQPIMPKDLRFVLLVAELSKIDKNYHSFHSYSGTFFLTAENVLIYKKWYYKNKNKIDCKEVENLLSSYQKEWDDCLLEQLIFHGVGNPEEALEKLKKGMLPTH